MQGRAGTPSCFNTKCGGGSPTQSRRYKTIENFLRRLAFNLGNSVSQTDVKILSCIPIDVTDLQQRIIELEKELSDKKASDKNGGDKNGDDKDTKARKNSRSSIDKGKEEKPPEGGETPEKPEGGEPEKKEVLMMQTKPLKVEPKARVGKLPAGQNYLKDYLNIDTTNEVRSLYKATKKIDKVAAPTNVLSNSNSSENLSSDHLVCKNKQKHNPFTVIMGNMKRHKTIETRLSKKQNRQTECKLDDSASSYSVTMPRLQNNVSRGCQDCMSDDEINKINTKPKKKYIKKNENVFSAFAPRNQYVYYAQTHSHFNPDFKKDNHDCDLAYIANLIEKQYMPMNLYNDKKVLNRQFSVPVCRDSADALSSKYAISGINPCSCCPATSSDLNVRNEGPIEQKYKECIQTNINGRYNDSTMYDIIPVKQNATKKIIEPLQCDFFSQKVRSRRSPKQFKSFVDIDPPFNLHPSHSLEIMYDTEHYEKSIHISNYMNKKKKHSPRRASPTRTRKEQKSTLGPEDIYMTKILKPVEASSLYELHKDCNSEKVKSTEIKTKETVTELKAILQDFIKEIKEDIPKINETPNPQDPKDVGNKQPAYQSVPLPSPYGFVPSYPPIIQTPQCCCPVLCPLNFIPDAFKAHPPGFCALPRNKSECCINREVPKGEADSNLVLRDDLSETKKLIREIYDSMSLQNEKKSVNSVGITKKVNETEIHSFQDGTINTKSLRGICTNPNKTFEPKTLMRNQCMQSDKQMPSSSSTETESKPLSPESETITSSVNTESFEMSIQNMQQISNDILKKEKKSKFSDVMKMFRSVSFKKSNETQNSSASEIQRQFSDERPSPFRQNITQYNAAYKNERPQKRHNMYTNQTINTDNPPEDVFNCCYFDKEAEVMENHRRSSPPRQFPRNFQRQNEPPGDRNPHMCPNQCFYMPEAQQIPYCLKEIEVKNAGTQSINKRKKLFAIFKRLKSSSEIESIPSSDQFQARRRGRHVITNETQTGTHNKTNGFLQFLKGEKNMDYADIYNKYNFIDTGKGGVGMKSPRSSFFNKNGGKLGKYMQQLEKKKRSPFQNPFTFKHTLMRTLIGQKPVANTKTAKIFY